MPRLDRLRLVRAVDCQQAGRVNGREGWEVASTDPSRADPRWNADKRSLADQRDRIVGQGQVEGLGRGPACVGEPSAARRRIPVERR
jgi:hypothetical protein